MMPSEHIMDYLLSVGDSTSDDVFLIEGENLFLNKMPSVSVTSLCIYDIGGKPTVAHNDFIENSPSITFLVIGTPGSIGSAEAVSLAENVKDILVEPFTYTVDGFKYSGSNQLTEITSLGYDKLNKIILSQDFSLRRIKEQ